MLSKKHRIIERTDFEVVCRYGRSVFYDKLLVKVRKNEFGLVRMGVSVGLKFSRKAVLRNLVKRQIRAFFRENLEKIKSGHDIIVIVQKGWPEKKNPQNGLMQIMQSEGLITERV